LHAWVVYPIDYSGVDVATRSLGQQRDNVGVFEELRTKILCEPNVNPAMRRSGDTARHLLDIKERRSFHQLQLEGWSRARIQSRFHLSLELRRENSNPECGILPPSRQHSPEFWD
jgi:hypothetical protein